MPFKLTEDYIEQVVRAVENNQIHWLERQVKKLHPADLAGVLNELPHETGCKLYNFLDDKLAGEVLIEMDETKREALLASLTSEQIADDIDHLPSDEATDVVQDLPDSIQDEVLRELEKDDAAQASDIADLLRYDENTAGGLMQKELVTVRTEQSMMDCVRQLRKHADHIEDVYVIYVVDSDGRLQGLMPLKKILITTLRKKVAEVYEKEYVSVNVHTPAEEAAMLMKKYDLVYMPVVDALGKLVGRLTIDDMVDVIHEEAGKDIQLMSGITEDVESSDKVWILSRARIPWLLVGLAGGIFGAQIISSHEDQIQIHPEMAFFIPLIAAMGGNAGVQSSAIIVQGLAGNISAMDSIFSKLFKEFFVGLINGIICSLLLLVYNLLFTDNLALTASVSTALLGVIVFSTLFGTFVPLMLNRYKVDPALATGPFITTTNDILGLVLYLVIGRLMYGIL